MGFKPKTKRYLQMLDTYYCYYFTAKFNFSREVLPVFAMGEEEALAPTTNPESINTKVGHVL